MSAPVSDIDVCNLALSHLKERSITSLTNPTNPAAVACAKWYDHARRTALRKAIWKFAKKRTELAQSATTPAFGWSYQYPLPTDFIRLCSVNDQNENTEITKDYDLEDGNILFNGELGTALPIVYIFDQTNVAKMDPLFIGVFAVELAIAMAFDIVGAEAPIARLTTLLKQLAPEAYAITGQEKPPVRVQRSKFIAARRGGRTSNVAGPTYYLD